MGRTSDAKAKLLEVAFDLIWSNSYGSVSVDQICDQAGVKKGSFYYFFPSKADLAVAAFEEYWRQCRPKYDEIFSPQVAPLQRIKSYCEAVYECQKQKLEQSGQVLGCPFASMGAEISTQDPKLRQKTQEMFERMARYLESALRDAHRDGLIAEQDFRATAESIYSYLMGMLIQAKIKNEVDVLNRAYPTIVHMVGAGQCEFA